MVHKSYDKYFCIGFNKTATTTLHNLFIKNKLKSIHGKSEVWDTSKYDCFSDITSGDTSWKKYDKEFKNAIFILNVRELDKWLISRFKHGIRRLHKFQELKKNNEILIKKVSNLYGNGMDNLLEAKNLLEKSHNEIDKIIFKHWAYPCTHELCRDWINLREKVHKEILDYFSEQPNKIIIVNIDREGWINYLCRQLNFKKNPSHARNATEGKRVRETDDEHNNIIKIVNETLEQLNYDKKTILFPIESADLLKKYKRIYI